MLPPFYNQGDLYEIQIFILDKSDFGIRNENIGFYPLVNPLLGVDWTIRESAAYSLWRSVCYGNGLFVAVANSGVMTSPDGIDWTARQSAANNNWRSVCYGNGLLVAVADTGTGNRVMTSPDGINWTIRQSAANNRWFSVCYGNGIFVAVAYNGTGNHCCPK